MIEFDTAQHARIFMLAGLSHITVQSKTSAERFTYRVRQNYNDGPSHYVELLTGPDNTQCYSYLGCIFDRERYSHGRKSKIDQSSPAAMAFSWIWASLQCDCFHPKFSLWHEGYCVKCKRLLTTPDSIRRGMGPVCYAAIANNA